MAGTSYVLGYEWSYLAKSLPSAERTDLAKRFGLSPDPEVLAQALAQRQHVQTTLSHLSDNARDLAQRLWFAGGQATVESVFQLPGALHHAVPELARAGLLVQLRIDYYHQVYALPIETQAGMVGPLIVPLLTAHATDGQRPDVVVAPSSPVWMTDLLRLLSHIRWSGGPLTQQGELYKRVRNQIVATFWPQHPIAPDQRLNQLLEFSTWAQLVQADHLRRRLDVTTEAERFWDGTPGDRWQRWTQFWLEAKLPSLPLAHVVWDSLVYSPKSGRLAISGLATLLSNTGLVAEGRARNIVSAALDMGQAYGWIEVSGKAAGVAPLALGAIYRKIAPSESTRAVIQPTGEAIVPVETPPALVWHAEETLSLKKADVVWTYQFDPHALERAVNIPISQTGALERLSALSRAPLPANVVAEIADGFSRASRVRVLEAVVVWAETPELTDILVQSLGPMVVERLADKVLTVSADDSQAVVDRLKHAGYAVRSAPERVGEPGSYALVEPIELHYPYRSHILVSLPGLAPDPKFSNLPDITRRLQDAIRAAETLRIQYVSQGQNTSTEVGLLPLAIQDGMLGGIALNDHRPVRIPVKQIVHVWKIS